MFNIMDVFQNHYAEYNKSIYVKFWKKQKPILCDGVSLCVWGLIEKRHEKTQGGDANVLDLGLHGCIHLSKFIELHNLKFVPFMYVHL